MYFLFAYSAVLLVVATVSTANRVKKALGGATELIVCYSLVAEILTQGEKNTNGGSTVNTLEGIHGTVAVSTETAVEYKDTLGFTVTVTQLLIGVDRAEKEKFPNLKSENIQKIKSIDSIELKRNNSTTSSEKLFRGGHCHVKDIYLVDVSEIQGAVLHNTYDIELNNEVKTKGILSGGAKIVSYKGKSHAQIYFPYNGMYTLKFDPRIQGSQNFPTTLAKENSTGLIVIRMAS